MSRIKEINMNKYLPAIAFLLWTAALPATAADAVEELLLDYQETGGGPFSAETGRALWLKGVPQSDRSPERSCATCHGSDLTMRGKHARTGKPIEAMLPTVNPQRLTDHKKIEKWFTRNCKWTWRRLCTPQEKGDLLRYIQNP
jgi:hypothetical protein